MNCNKCGFVINENDQVCPNCGNPLTALSHNEVVMQDIPEKVENTVVNENVPVNEPVFIETPTQNESVVPTPIVEPTPVIEEVKEEVPLTGLTNAVAPTVEPKKNNKTKLIIIVIIALLIIGAGVFFGIKYLNNKTPEPIPLEEEEEVLEERYYPIGSATGAKIIEEYDYYRVQAKELVKGKYDLFESKLRVEASKITIEDSEFEAIFTSYDHSEKKDVITRINTTSYKGDTTIETSMDITVYSEERVKEILKAFVDLYSNGTNAEDYDAYGSYDGGYRIECANNITMIIGYNELEEDGYTYYEINILESI